MLRYGKGCECESFGGHAYYGRHHGGATVSRTFYFDRLWASVCFVICCFGTRGIGYRLFCFLDLRFTLLFTSRRVWCNRTSGVVHFNAYLVQWSQPPTGPIIIVFRRLSGANIYRFVKGFFLTESILLFPCDSRGVASQPHGARSYYGSGDGGGHVPSVFRYSGDVSFRGTIRAVVGDASKGRESCKDGGGEYEYFFASSYGGFYVRVYGGTDRRDQGGGVSPRFFSRGRRRPTGRTTGYYRERVFLFCVGGGSGSCETGNSNGWLCRSYYDRDPGLPGGVVTPVGPDTDTTTDDGTTVEQVVPRDMSPVDASLVTFISVGPKVGDVVSPVVVLSVQEGKRDGIGPRVTRPMGGSTAG